MHSTDGDYLTSRVRIYIHIEYWGYICKYRRHQLLVSYASRVKQIIVICNA